MKVAVYCRVATTKQLGADLITAQQQRVAGEAKKLYDGALIDEYLDYGGANDRNDLPAFHKLLAAAECGSIEAVVIENPTRIARNIYAVYRAERLFRKNGVDINYLQGGALPAPFMEALIKAVAK